MTFLQIVNKILVRLRENTVTTVDQNSYSTLVGEFVNDAKNEVEGVWKWTKLRDTVSITTSNGTSSYEVSGLNPNFILLDIYNSTEETEMRVASRDWMSREYNLSNNQNSAPYWFNFHGNTNNNPQIRLWPVPDGVYTINLEVYNPQAYLVSGTDENTEVLAPNWPIIYKALLFAIEERGIDGGITPRGSHFSMLYDKSLMDAIDSDGGLVSEEFNIYAD